VKKWLLAAGLGLAMVTSAQAADKIAVVNMGNLFQQVAQTTGVSKTLDFRKWKPICSLKCSVCSVMALP
jgi:outer membrane protein